MADVPAPLDGERLALERDRLRTERQKLAIDLRLKRREWRAANDSKTSDAKSSDAKTSDAKTSDAKTWKEVFSNPIALAIVGGVLTIFTTLVTTSFTAKYNRDAANLALQAELIKKFVDAPKTEIVRENLRFLVDAGLLPDYASGISGYLTKNPNSAPTTSSGLVGGVVGPTDQRIAFDKAPPATRGKFIGVGLVKWGGKAICTGFMVSPNIMMSARHCFPEFNPASNTIPPAVTFQLFPISPETPNAAFDIDVAQIATLQRSSPEQSGFSVAAAPLADSSIALPYLSLESRAPVIQAPLETAFFTADTNGSVYSAGPDCRAVAIEDEELRHLCDTGNGSSGAPLLSSSGAVVAIHVGRDSGNKRAIRADIVRSNADMVKRFGVLPMTRVPQAVPR